MAIPKKDKSQPPATVQNFPIVGIGASAGGLDAFKRLLTAIPESSGMAYVLVQHLNPSHESILPEILQRVTKIPVHEITDDIHLAPDHIYIIPANKILTSTDGVLQLTARDKKILNLSIDTFFTSLADVHKEFAVGVVLSGTGSDGTLGLKAIKDHGGISIAQDLESAAYQSMPQSAVNAGVVDFILAPEKIPAELLKINSSYKTNHFFKQEEEQLPKNDEDNFKQILLLLRQRSGADFTYYKRPTFHRRIARRIAIAKKKNLADYLKFLRTDKAEQDALFQDVLIPVTSFFRDPQTFQRLAEIVFPAIFKNKTPEEPIRVWIAGCSTGEEAFSIAITLREFLGEKLSSTQIQIFASDISEKTIRHARAAIYSKADVATLSATQLGNYFTKNNGGYELKKIIREMCVFAPHNFLKDPPFAKMDLISCRNVLIYMDTFLQKKAFSTFHYALKENGFLLLGKSETPGASSDLFTQVEKYEKIYSRKPLPGRFMHVATQRREEALTTKDKTVTRNETVHTDFRKSAEAIMISKSPASVIVNETMDIVHIYGDITAFLQAPQGKPTHNLIKMAREGLAFELRNAVHKAMKDQSAVTKENIPVNAYPRLNDGVGQGKQSLVTIEIIPLINTVDPHFLIRFEKIIIPVVQEETKSSSGNIKTAEAQKRNEQLEKEFSQTREDIRSITEDMEAANEELQSANEELQSSNEEMQSLNEELETSKEELQSTNEELLIVNQELLDKQDQLNASRFYSEAIVTTMREPLVILDRTLCVKTANASFYTKFNVEEKETENILFYEIQNNQFDDPTLRSLLEKILPQKNRIEDYEIKLRLPDKGERIILINARQIVNEIKAEQLILLAMEDVTDRINAGKQLSENAEEQKKIVRQFELATDSAKAGIWSLNLVSSKLEWSDIHKKMWGYEVHREDLTYEDWHKLILPEDKALVFQRVEESKVNHTIYKADYRITRANDGDVVWINSTGQYYYNEFGVAHTLTGISIDITEQKETEQKLKESEERFRCMAETIPQKIFTSLPNGDNDYLNPQWSEFTGLLLEQIINWGWLQVVHPDDKEENIRLWTHSLDTGKPFKFEHRIRGKDGTYCWHLTHAHAMRNDSGTIIKWFGSTTNIHEQKMIEQQKDEFISIASHEMKTPLTVAKGYIQLLQRSLNEENQSASLFANKISLAVKRLNRLTTELLDASKIQNGQLNYNITTFDFNKMVDEAIENFQHSAKSHIIQKTGDIRQNLTGDRDRLEQVLINFLSNAIKYSPNADKVLIKIEEQDKKIQVSVQDFGVGMLTQHLDKIFQKYYRVREHAVQFQGLGIGLYISYSIIERHGGRMWVESEPEKGSTFYFNLPV